MIWLPLVHAAHATPLVPHFDVSHQWKVEVYFYAPATDPYSSDHRDTEMEVTAVTLRCVPSGRPRLDHCSPLEGKIYLGYRLVGAPAVRLHELSTEGTLELAYNERGRVTRSDWLGDRSGFWAASCHALLELDRTVDATTHICTEDAARRWGARFEQSVTQGLLGALDVELPKNGEHGGEPWKATGAPWAGRRYLSGAMASTNGKWTVDLVNGAPRVRFAGMVAENPVSSGSVSDYTTESATTVEVTLNAANRPARVEAHAIATSTGILYGFAQTDTWLSEVPGEAATPPGPEPRATASEATGVK